MWSAILRFFRNLFNNDLPKLKQIELSKPVNSEPNWLKIAKLELGVLEIRGSKNNNRIIEYHKTTSLRATTDEVSWCSSFINWVMNEAGIPGTNSAAARSWLKWGVAIDKPRVGCVVVFWRGKKSGWNGHVALYIKEDKKYLYVLGGNQSDQVSIAKYPKSRLLGYRWNAS